MVWHWLMAGVVPAVALSGVFLVVTHVRITTTPSGPTGPDTQDSTKEELS
jgi:hypothetical protein